MNSNQTRDALRRALSLLPQDAKQAGPILTRVGLAILGRIKKAFIAKARGGADEAGDTWPPLSTKTVAYGRRGRSRAEKRRNTFPSQALNKKQAARWWELYRKGLAIFKGDKGAAARYAWAVSKREGATTLFEKYKGRSVEILRDTGLLLNSLSPGYGGSEQVFRTEAGSVTVGTTRKGAAAHHSGVPGRLPQRRLWPEPSKWPGNWWADLLDQVKQGLLELAVKVARGR